MLWLGLTLSLAGGASIHSAPQIAVIPVGHEQVVAEGGGIIPPFVQVAEGTGGIPPSVQVAEGTGGIPPFVQVAEGTGGIPPFGRAV